MNPRPQTDPAAQAAVDDALRTYPLRPTPATLAPRVMARLRALPAPPRFRLAWIDYALCLLATVMAAVALTFWRLAPPESLARAQQQIVILLQRTGLATPRPEWVVAVTAVGLAAGLLLVGVGVWRSAGRASR
jgi:hypothetical protein